MVDISDAGVEHESVEAQVVSLYAGTRGYLQPIAFKTRRLVESQSSLALGAASLEVWASAANATKSLDRKTVAEAIRGKTVGGTILGDVAFEPNGQAKHKHTIFKVTDGKTAKIEVVK